MKKRSVGPSDCQLQEMVQHVTYEIDEYRANFDRWRGSTGFDQPQLNRIVEAALLHYRVLIEFFMSEPKQKDDSVDVVASDYLPTDSQSDIAKRGEDLWNTYKSKIDQRLAHLTTGRLRPRATWKIGAMENEMERVIDEFRDSLAEPQKTWFGNLGPVVRYDPADVANGTASVVVGAFPFWPGA